MQPLVVEDVRIICRRERPHPGAQLSLFDTLEGFRHQCFLTTSPGEIAELELRHRGHARVEDRIRAAKDMGLRNLPFRDVTGKVTAPCGGLLAPCGLSPSVRFLGQVVTCAFGKRRHGSDERRAPGRRL
jgi:hypothetical protein